MADPAKTVDQNILPVQALFNLDNSFNTFIGQGQPFYATVNPSQYGLAITNSTIDSTTIGATTPSTGVFTNIFTTTGQILTAPSGNTDIANKAYVDAIAQGLNPKAAVKCATTASITLSGLQTIDGYTTLAGDRVLVKNETSAPTNGIYIAASGAWTRSTDMDVWAEVPGAYCVVLNGSVNGNTAWVSTSADTGTIGTTPITFVQFAGTGTYYAGTGLTLASNTFSITNTGVTAASYGSASSVPVLAINAQGQVTSASSSSIAIAASQITSGTISSSLISGSYTGITGVGTLTAGTWNASTIGVPYGGTGATTFTAGYLKASGTSAFSTVSTIPSTDITGLGTMSTQNANSVAITGGTISGLSSPLAVASGGTGAATLTGYVYGNGTGALTASTTIPNTAISGLGTMSTQNANAVSITGGTINGASIGATTRSSGDFTTLSANTVTNTTPVLSFNASNSIASFGSTTSGSYNQLVIQNKSGTANASTNYVISNDLGTDSTYYGEFGMNSSVYSSGTYADFFSINNGIYFSGHDGDISIGSGNGYKHYFVWGTVGQSAHVINASGALGFTTNLGTTPANTGTSGYGTSGQVLITAGSSAAPSWGVVGISGGGTNGTATPTAGAVSYGTGTDYAFTSAGTSGQVLTSNGVSAPTWSTPSASITVTDDTTTNATRYPLFANATSGTVSTEYVSSTKYQFNPSTGVLTATGFSGSGASLTSLTAGNLTGTIPSAVLGNSIVYIGTTAIALNRASASQTLTGTSIDGNAGTATTATTATNATNTATTDDTSTNATMYPVWKTNTTGNLGEYVSSSKLQWNPSTGVYKAPIINATTNVTFQDSSTQNTAATGFGFKNRIINGAMMIDQRNAGASVTPTTGQYLVDRFVYYSSQASKFTAQQNAGSVTPPVGFVNYLGYTSTSAYSVGASDYFVNVQIVEGLNVADLGWGAAGAATVTLSFWVRSSLTGAFGGSVSNSSATRSYPFTYTISSANTWEQKSITIAGDTSGTWLKTNGQGILIYLGLGVGSTFSGTAGSWAGAQYLSATGATSVVGTNGATFYITGVQLEKGSTATSFDYRPYGTELALCQRYYQKYLSTNGAIFRSAGTLTGNIYYWMPLEVAMRVAPTMSVGSPIYSNASGASWANIGQDGAEIFFTATLSGGYAFIPWTATSEL